MNLRLSSYVEAQRSQLEKPWREERRGEGGESERMMYSQSPSVPVLDVLVIPAEVPEIVEQRLAASVLFGSNT